MVRAWLGGSFPLGGMLEAGMSAGTKRGGRRKWKREDDKLRACGSRELGKKFFIWCVRGCGGEKKNRVLCWMWLLLALFLVYKDLPVMSTGQRILRFKIRFFLFFLPPLPPPASGMHAYKKNESPSLSKTANGMGIP